MDTFYYGATQRCHPALADLYPNERDCPYSDVIRKDVDWDESKDLNFQIVSWHDNDQGEVDDYIMEEILSAEDTYSLKVNDPREYTMYLFGLTQDGVSVCTKVTGFKAFFYVRIPDGWSNVEVEKFIKYIYYILGSSLA